MPNVPGGELKRIRSATLTVKNPRHLRVVWKTIPHKAFYGTPWNHGGIPQQLLIPVTIGAWTGAVLLDTGYWILGSYTLISEHVWNSSKSDPAKMKQWKEGPLYLADGNQSNLLGPGLYPLSSCPIRPAMVLPAMLGLDFMFISGIQVDVSTPFWFLPGGERYRFLSDAPGFHDGGHPPTSAFFSAVHPKVIASSLNADDLQSYQEAVDNTFLQGPDKAQLLKQLHFNADVCSSRLGHAKILNQDSLPYA